MFDAVYEDIFKKIKKVLRAENVNVHKKKENV